MTGVDSRPLGSQAAGDRAAVALRSGRPLVCGILNVTPDSFSDGGRFIDPELAVGQGLLGQHLLGVGLESTRPGAEPLSAGYQPTHTKVHKVLAPSMDLVLAAAV